MNAILFSVGDVISYIDMCKEEGVNLQRGMNFHLHNQISIILMSLRKGAPYTDRVEENGKVLIYEGHDIARTLGGPPPKTVDQPMRYPSGKLTQNGLFHEAASKFKSGISNSELVKVYEKIRPGIWSYNGKFKLADSWQEKSKNCKVFKFRLELSDSDDVPEADSMDLDHTRIIPSAVKLEVWYRDKGSCVCAAVKITFILITSYPIPKAEHPYLQRIFSFYVQDIT